MFGGEAVVHVVMLHCVEASVASKANAQQGGDALHGGDEWSNLITCMARCSHHTKGNTNTLHVGFQICRWSTSRYVEIRVCVVGWLGGKPNMRAGIMHANATCDCARPCVRVNAHAMLAAKKTVSINQ